MKISVTQKHIDAGWTSDCGQCPIALAIRQQTRFKNALVGCTDWNPDESCDMEWVELPVYAQVFIGRFDYGSAVAPFEFDLEIPA